MPDTAPWDSASEDGWASFLAGTADRPPLPFFDQAMRYADGHVGDGRLAIDLGCGSGAETLALLDMGWEVLAVDASPSAERLIQERLKPDQVSRVSIAIGRFEEVELPSADLLYAQMSLPFAGRALGKATANAVAAVDKGGVFAGHFFGDNDDWIDDVHVAAVDREWLTRQFSQFSDLHVTETHQDGPYGLEGKRKHWHYYFVLARR